MKTGKRKCPDCNKVFEWYHQIIRINKVVKIPDGKMKAKSYIGPDENDNYKVNVHCWHCDFENEFLVTE